MSAIIKLKNRKSLGENGIRNELLKYGEQPLISEINKLFQKIIHNRNTN